MPRLSCGANYAGTRGRPRAAVKRFQGDPIRIANRAVDVTEYEGIRRNLAETEFKPKLLLLRCCFSTASALAGRKIVRVPALLFGSLIRNPCSLVFSSARLMLSLPASKSMSAHCRAISSPRLMPVVSSTTTCG